MSLVWLRGSWEVRGKGLEDRPGVSPGRAAVSWGLSGFRGAHLWGTGKAWGRSCGGGGAHIFVSFKNKIQSSIVLSHCILI